MNEQEYILIDIFCKEHDVELSFIHSLEEFGLIELIVINETKFIPISQYVEVAKLARLHSELEINTQGIDAVLHLLKQINTMKSEIIILKNRLGLYESDL